MNITLNFSDYAVMIAYLTALVVIGIVTAGRQNDTKNFLLGGGKMPWFALGISCLMAALSAFSLVMIPGEIFNHGLNFFIFGLITPLFTLVTCKIFMRFYFKLGSFTPFEYLEYRYDGSVRSLIAGLTIYLRLIYLGMVLFSTSKVFEGAAGWSPWFSIPLIGFIALVFTSSGGLKAVVWTDVMQFIVLIGGLFCILGFLFYNINGGVIEGITCPFRNGHGLDEFAKLEFYTLNPYARLSIWLLLLGAFMSPITTMASDQMTIQRLLASGSYEKAQKTQLINTLLTIPTLIILWVIGLCVFTYFHQNPDLKPASGDTALFNFISMRLPSPLPGLVLAGMLAAVISTLNAVFNSMATVYCKEFHIRYFKKNLDEPGQVKVSRIATVTIGLLAIALGLLVSTSAETLRQSVVEASTVFNAFDAIVIPAFLFAVLSKRASTVLVWVTAGVVWGVKLAMITWFFASQYVMKTFTVGSDPSWAGPQGIGLIIWPLAVTLLTWIIWAIYKYRNPDKRYMILLTLASSAAGALVGAVIWYIVSNTLLAQGEGKALSFTWVALPSIVSYAVLGTIWLLTGPVPPKEKYQGLTLFDAGEVIQNNSDQSNN